MSTINNYIEDINGCFYENYEHTSYFVNFHSDIVKYLLTTIQLDTYYDKNSK